MSTLPTNIRNSAVHRDLTLDNLSVQQSTRLPVYSSAYEPSPLQGYAPGVGNRGELIFSKTSNTTGRVKYNQGGNTWVTVGTGDGTGDVVGPASSTDNAVARFDGTTGKLLQNSSVTVSDAGLITAAGIAFTDTNSNASLARYSFYTSPFTTVSGPVASTAISANDIVVIGGLVWLDLPNFSAAATGSDIITINPVLAASLRPLVARTNSITVIDNGVYLTGTIYISTAGVVTVGVGESAAATAFSGTGTTGFQTRTVVYNL